MKYLRFEEEDEDEEEAMKRTSEKLGMKKNIPFSNGCLYVIPSRELTYPPKMAF